jgi:hypothetical protein
MAHTELGLRERRTIEVLAQVDDGRLSVQNGSNLSDITIRQMFRVLKRYRTKGAPAIRHKARGKAANNLKHAAKRDDALLRFGQGSTHDPRSDHREQAPSNT